MFIIFVRSPRLAECNFIVFLQNELFLDRFSCENRSHEIYNGHSCLISENDISHYQKYHNTAWLSLQNFA